MPISNKGIIKKKKEFSFPELDMADRALSDPEIAQYRGKYLRPGEETEAFGPELMKNKKFKKELRRLEEKHKFRALV